MKSIGIIIGILFALGVVALVGVHVFTYAQLFVTGIILKRKLSRDGRTVTLQEAQLMIAQDQGCIVVDAPTLGWNVFRVWWAPWRPIPSQPAEKDSDRPCSQEDQTNYEALIDPVTGAAKLICPFLFTQRLRPYLKLQFGLEECPLIFTGGVIFKRALEKKRAEQVVSPNGS